MNKVPIQNKTDRKNAKRSENLDRAKAIGARIKQARHNKGLSQHDLALLLGITAGAVGQWEIGANLPQMSTFQKLVEVLDVSRDWLMIGDSPRERGIAQDVTEKRALVLIRELTPEGRVAAITAMEGWKHLEAGDPLSIVNLIERWSNLPAELRMAASSMIDGLARTNGIASTSIQSPKQPNSSKPRKQTRGKAADNVSSR